jgi:hypothetical protein
MLPKKHKGINRYRCPFCHKKPVEFSYTMYKFKCPKLSPHLETGFHDSVSDAWDEWTYLCDRINRI